MKIGNRTSKRQKAAGIVLAIVLACANTLLAQSEDAHWGVAIGYVPRWQTPDVLGRALNHEVDLRGQEFRLGLTRGRDLGGDWGIDALYKLVQDGSEVQVQQRRCVTGPDGTDVCSKGGFRVTRDVGAGGVEVHTFLPFATIGERTQIGVNLAAGLGWLRGIVEEHVEHLEAGVDQATGRTSLRVADTMVGEVSPQRLIPGFRLRVVPLVKAEAAMAFLAARGVKVRVAAGINSPGYNAANVQLQFLFGAR